jgi:molybdopterin molybdotransferase
MAQLSNDCFAFGDTPLSLDDALDFIKTRVPVVAGENTHPLADCDGLILARDAISISPLPAFFNAAVDGYAVRLSDLSASEETRLPVIGRLQAGALTIPALKERSAMRIFTGAPMPDGADTIFMQEDVLLEGSRLEGKQVVLPQGLKPGANCRPAGEEVGVDHVIIKAGTRLLPQHLALAAGAGLSHLNIRSPIRVAVFSTGDELVEPGAKRHGAQVFDTNRLMLVAMLKRIGCIVQDLGVLKDDPDHITSALRAAAGSNDLLLTSGGVSTGEADYVKAAVEAEGRLDHWRFAIKPGRPLAMGVIGNAAFAGLPGNPVAVFVTFTQIVRAVLAALAGETYRQPQFLQVRAGFAHRKKTGRIEFLRVSLEVRANGLTAIKYPVEGAGIISSLTETDGLVRLPLDMVDFIEGEMLDYLPFSAML